MEEYKINLKKSGETVSLNPIFKHATNGQSAEFTTSVSVSYSEKYLSINFECLQDEFVKQNNMTEHNAPLYNQEVFEVFISPGEEDSKHYLEIEINPKNALWVGKINNPSLGSETQTLDSMIEHADAGINHSISVAENSWKGTLDIPWSLIGNDKDGKYRLNFYRIRANQSHENPDWTCNAETCDFVCWSPTMSGNSPAFHRPKQFGHLIIGE
ncbi:carbohydrate-binding family 9-like protein [Lacihabitans sp. LS3-19]|uniref:carbohydrate-binding family 9-like protein n=1 Tax=Lacihabitans sp. LS3-19 TaxID=2487335 RepID=UPI0020CBD5F2|nr:carbohydrate-binding family 9-like protein [Lacihabitans sp. LS3-19]